MPLRIDVRTRSDHSMTSNSARVDLPSISLSTRQAIATRPGLCAQGDVIAADGSLRGHLCRDTVGDELDHTREYKTLCV